MTTYTPTRLLDPTVLPAVEVTATPGLLGAAVPGATTWVVKEVVICNTAAVPVTVSLSIVPNGGAGGAANRILSGATVQANETKVIDLAQVMKTGDFITGVASVAGDVVVTISGQVIA